MTTMRNFISKLNFFLLKKRIRSKFLHIEQLRPIVERIDPRATVIVTYSSLCHEAIEHYKSSLPSSCPLPEFLFVDWDGKAALQCEGIVQNHGVTALPGHRIKTVDKKICAYARGMVAFWEANGIGGIFRFLHNASVHSYLIDSVGVSEFWRRPASSNFFDKNISDICRIYAALSDVMSKDVFLRAVKALATGEAGFLPISEYEQYQHPCVQAVTGDTVIEGGIDLYPITTQTFSKQVGELGRVFAFEARPTLAGQLRESMKPYTNVTIEGLGLWSSPGVFYIEDAGGGSRLVDAPTAHTEECHSITIDDYVAQNGITCTLLKLDIEGAELECLHGALRTLQKNRPKLQISIYHTAEQYIEIAIFLLNNIKDYDFYIGHHLEWYYETCLYGIPREAPTAAVAPSGSSSASTLNSSIFFSKGKHMFKRLLRPILLPVVNRFADKIAQRQQLLLAGEIQRLEELIMRLAAGPASAPAQNHTIPPRDSFELEQKTLAAYAAYKDNTTHPKLQIGADINYLEGWFNTDLIPRPEYNIHHLDLKKTFPFADNSFRYIYCEHNIEHFTVDEAKFMLDECHRVLVPGGIIRIATPDLQKLIAFYQEETDLHGKYRDSQTKNWLPQMHAAKIRSKALVLNNFFRNWGHQTIYDFESLRSVVALSGFVNIEEKHIGESSEPDLTGIERHGDNIPEEFNELETMVLEAKKSISIENQ